MHEKKSVFIGMDYTNLQWHPGDGVDRELEDILGQEFDLTFSEHYESLNPDDMKHYDAIILYTDQWADKTITVPAMAANFLTYVANGGSLMVLHNPSIAFDNELAQMVGARFKMHPPYCRIDYVNLKPEHAIMQGIESFSLEDELYQLHFDHLTKRTVLLGQMRSGIAMPAAWISEFGLGRVIYIVPGHNRETFRNLQIRQLVRQSARWAVRMI